MDPARVLVEFGDPAAWPNGARGASTGGGYALFAWGSSTCLPVTPSRPHPAGTSAH